MVVRPAFLWLLRRNQTESGHPSPFMVFVTLMVVLLSAFMTDLIGIHAIFGGFISGLIMLARRGGFAIGVTEKLKI